MTVWNRTICESKFIFAQRARQLARRCGNKDNVKAGIGMSEVTLCLPNRNSIALHCVPSYIGIQGIENTDVLARKASGSRILGAQARTPIR